MNYFPLQLPVREADRSTSLQNTASQPTDNQQTAPDISKTQIRQLEATNSSPQQHKIHSRNINIHEFKNKLSSAAYPIDPPPPPPSMQTAEIADDINDNEDCYLLNAEQFDIASSLTSYAAKELKTQYPELFAGMDSDPEESDGGGWDEIMSQPKERKHYKQYQAIAKYIYDYQESDRLDEIMDDMNLPWTSCRTTYGIYRTDSFYYFDEGLEGSQLIIDHEYYKLSKETEALKRKLAEVKNKTIIATTERDYYKSMVENASVFTSNILSEIGRNIFNTDITDDEKAYSLNATFFEDSDRTFNELLARGSLIIGEERSNAEASFNAQKSPQNKRKTFPDNQTPEKAKNPKLE
ncbi:hypothetical protein [Endozoicomonas sp. SCSIO W0465]|uniref:hypothetical protein n=1 Tax=Endozoicomonas sp. SCSIO W0465 TaxID=2918516 RepID=UPI0020751043|nr:hypothetical protein [Endozoicomonas sp. SCSIO W0465]USE34015.1 hypothetical protein MJO57_17780 [Endozoicomonas sp. SCSIO W0465]